MNTIHTSLRLTTIDRWLAPHAAAIIAFAESDSMFAWTLALMISEENWSIVEGPTVTTSTHLLPSDHTDAEDVLDWLMYELVAHPETRVSRSLLSAWARDYESPKNFTIGIEGTSLVGPTLSLVSQNKKRSQLQIITDATWQASLNIEQLCEVTHALSQELISVELRKAGGKIGSLHPDTAEWSMGGTATKLYSTNKTTIERIHKIALAEELHHKTVIDKEKIVAIAISPSVQDKFAEELL